MLAAERVALDVGVLTFVIGVAIPMLTGLITKSTASSAVKAIVTLTLVVASTTVQFALDANGVVNLRNWLMTALVTWIISIASYYGLLKPTGTTAAVQNIAPNAGIGKAA